MNVSFKIEYTKSIFVADVTYDIPIEQAIRACKFNYFDEKIIGSYAVPIKTGTETRNFGLVAPQIGMKEPILIEAINEYIRKIGFRPASSREGMKFCEKFPELQRKMIIVVPEIAHKELNFGTRTLVLSGSKDFRAAYLGYPSKGYLINCRFLVTY
jgi:hypothetical protein